MTGSDLIKYIKGNKLEDKKFYIRAYGDEFDFIQLIVESDFEIDVKNVIDIDDKNVIINFI